MARARNISLAKHWPLAIVAALILAACASHKPKHPRPVPAAPPPSTAWQRGQSFGIYEVKPGDTLSKIASRYRVSVTELASWNGISDPNLIQANTALWVPRAGSPMPPVPPPVTAPPPSSASQVSAHGSPGESGAQLTPTTPPPPGSAEPTVTAATPADDSPPRHAALVHPPPKPGFSFSPELLARARGELERAEERYAVADFQGALSRADTAQQLVAPLPDDREAREVFARAAVVAGMAQAASDHDAEAVAHFREALARDPDVTLEPNAASPKLQRLFDSARQ